MIQRFIPYRFRQIIWSLLLVLSMATATLAQTEIRLYNGPTLGGPTLGGPTLGGPTLGGPTLGGPTLGGPTLGAGLRPETTQPDRSFNRVVYNVSSPTLTAYLPDPARATGRSVLIFPGGGLSRLFIDEQGVFVAQQLAENGVAAFVVKYRLAQRPVGSSTDPLPQLPASVRDSALTRAVADGATALTYLRQHSTDLGIQPDRIGLLGFAAGGTIALRLGTTSDGTLRPAFLALIDPDITTQSTPTVQPTTPPLFLVTATNQTQPVLLAQSQLYQDWLRAGRPTEQHSYPANATDPNALSIPLDKWIDRLTTWIGELAASSPPPPVSPSATQTAPPTLPAIPPSVPASTPTTSPANSASTASAPATNSSPAALKPADKPVSSRRPEKQVVRQAPVYVSGPGGLVTGVVRDSATGTPLAGVAIVVDYRRHLTGTSTNDRGQYNIDLTAGEHVLVTRLVGYTPVRKIVQVSNTGALRVDINMVSVASQLEEVVVTTKGFDQTIRQPLLGVSQINIATLRKLPAALGEVDLLRGLQSLPGVTSVGEASNGVNIRGGTTDQNLILLDETPIFNPTHMFGLFSVFPTDVLSTVDLYKGNVPARFGGRAASVLDVSLRNPNLDQFQLSGGVSFVSNRLTADIPIVKGKLGLLVAGRGAFNDFLLPRISNRLAGIRARFGDGVTKLFWRIDDRNTLTATGYYSKDEFQTSLLASLPNVNGTTTRYDHQTINGMARWFHTFSPRTSLQTSAVWVDYVPKILAPELNSTNTVTLYSAVRQRQIKSNLNYQFTNQKLEVGLSGTQYRIQPGTLLPGASDRVNYITTPTENGLELAAYADYERSITPDLAVSAGLRYSHFLALGPSLVRRYLPGQPRDELSVIDSVRYGAGQVSKQYGGFEPRLGIRYSLSPTASVKFGYNLMRQYLQVVTNTTTPLPTSRWKTADANIRPQVSQLVSAGYFMTFHKDIYELTVEGYWRSTENSIDYRPGADFLLQPYPEAQLLQGRSRSYGVETMISKKRGEMTGWLNYTYARTFNQVYEGPTIEQNINGGAWYRANYDRPHTVNASLTFDVDKHNSFGFTFAYSTGRPYTAPTGYVTIDGAQYPYYGVRNQARLPDYHRLDFVWNIYNPSLQNRRWQGKWAFTIYNLYGRRNAYSVFFRTENGKTNSYQLQIFATPIASLSYNFIFK
ncbi:TonB-dependent receptor domain-containing protein [Spirosoma rhododendri]|uniref:TonB-dependent receptor plug domain-containing protein n=1 Tax=Spirosoma rhododendri TaxID=2728024 RepID=A0A7L5DMW9_9BACT|nr:TonB-dependent receptor [Spirosoma rhododendri]QJD79746.1 TonB-dependent receptor plug domain-containing protein [Spirosoma rhododendri]